MTAADLVDLLIRRAPELRAVGVLQFQLEGGPVILAPAEPEGTARAADTVPAEPLLDPLDDPMTYGGGDVPGYRIPERPTEDLLDA